MKLLPSAAEASDLRGAWLERLLILLLFYLRSGWPPPEVNEAHYLAKARHYWDPQWCQFDFFLNSADAHEVFYWTFGWVAAVAGLPAAAWIGRLVTWVLLAWTWQRLSFALVPARFAAVLSAATMIVLTTYGHMAGEWIVGGVEAKGFAFVLVFLGLEKLVHGRWHFVWPLLGAAAAFHVLVGGWSVIAAMIAWAIRRDDRPTLVRSLPSLAAGFVLSLPGLVPVLLLNRGTPAEIVAEANLIYVFERLPHHLVFHEFPWLWIARHALLIVVLVFLARRVAPLWASPVTSAARASRLHAFVVGAIVLSLCGIAIDQIGVALLRLWPDSVRLEAGLASLLRFYWFRLADVMVPCGVALLLLVAIERWRILRPDRARWALIALLLGTCLPLAIANFQRQQRPVPGAVLQSYYPQRYELPWDQFEQEFHDWQRVCVWIQAETPADAIFLTPRAQQTFKWYAQRAEVVSVKDVPQDAQGIVAWRARIRDVYRPMVSQFGFAVLPDEEIIALANRYDASYVIVETRKYASRPGLTRVYPPPDEENDSYAVYRIPPSQPPSADAPAASSGS